MLELKVRSHRAYSHVHEMVLVSKGDRNAQKSTSCPETVTIVQPYQSNPD